mgnify:FL=1
MKKILLILLACLPLFAIAKDNKEKNNSDPKYLAGALTYEDGKITFTREINAPGLSKDEIYQRMLDWANERFQPEDGMQSRVVYTNKEDGDIAASAEEWMVFSSTALSLDRTRVYYQLTAKAGDGQCLLTMSRIRYWYDNPPNKKKKPTAEEWINDKMALNKKQTKLAPICGKFRRETIDLKDELFLAATNALGQAALAAPAIPATPVVPATPSLATPSGKLQDISFAQLPANLNEMTKDGRITLTANDEVIDIKAENWGGFGQMFNKNVSYLLIDQSRYAASTLMEHNDTYRISFYTARGTEPAVVIECRKSTTQKMSAEELKSLNQSIDPSKEYTLYIGEITRIQAR